MPAAKLSKGSTMHSAGIYADMTVDGPEIGTLVVIVDRARNLPNKKSMGKQDPYCNCRLAKEAKKTKTDKRGGQVPKWDEELRFTVRDSADYFQLKVSIFNDDKKTELIGEAWVDLENVVTPGGGQSDIWHNLNCKGKYAGEVRLEMTYYDSRPKPEKPVEKVAMDSVRDGANSANGSRHNTPVKRRPLPSGPGASQGSSSGDYGSRPLPPTSGPRELGTPSRPLPQPANGSASHTPSSNRKTMYNNNQPQPVEHRSSSQQHYYAETPDDPFIQEPQYSPAQQDPYSAYGGYEPHPPPEPRHSEYPYQDNPVTGLPELPPMTSHRRQGSNRPHQEPPREDYNQPTPPRQPELHHAHSAPQVPVSAPYPEDMMHPRNGIQHTHSDSYMNHGQPAQHEYEEPHQQIRDHYSPQPQEMDASSIYQYPSQPQSQPVQLAPVHEGYNHIPPTSIYRRPSDQYDRPASAQYQLDAPPPPPAHRDSAPNSARRESYSSFAPAPLNITPLRRSPSPLPSHEPDHYSPHPYTTLAEYGRRNTAPIDSSPQDQHIYRPRAMSGEAMAKLNRPPSRDERYTLPPSHPDYYSPITGTPPEFPDMRETPSRRESYQPQYQPTQRSPLAVESPQSFRDDRSSLPSQQNTPSRGSDLYQQPLPSRAHPTPPRPFTNHHYSSSEPYVPPTNYQTPPRQHPLAQQVPASSSPNSFIHPTPPQDQVPIAKPIALSSHATPSSEPRQPRLPNRNTPTTRKSVSPRPPLSDQPRPSSTHFDPDSFNRFNPAALSSTSSLVNHPATSSHGSTPAKDTPYTRDGKIVDFHGNHIDPSDRLPETAWAPEPEPKGPVREKPFRERERIGGARDLNVTLAPRPSPRASMGAAASSPAESPTTTVATGGGGVIRARLRKKERPASAIVMSNSTSVDRPFRDIPNPEPPQSQWSSPLNAMRSSPNLYGSPEPGVYGDNGTPSYGSPRYYGSSERAPPIPAKIPLPGDAYGGQSPSSSSSPYYHNNGYGGSASPGYMDDSMAALSAEVGRIDIGPADGSGRARVARGRMLGFRS